MADEAGRGGAQGREAQRRRDGPHQGRDQQAEGAPMVGARTGARRGESPKALKRASVNSTAIRWHNTQAFATWEQAPGGADNPITLFKRLKAISMRRHAAGMRSAWRRR